MPRVSDLPAELADLHPDPHTEPFWEAAREHRLVAQRCGKCATFRMPPGPFCHVCRSQDVDWVELPGTGTVFTYTVTRHALIPAMRDAVPYAVVVVALDGAPGTRLVGTFVGGDPDTVSIGTRVAVAWDDLDEFTTVPRFRELSDTTTRTR
jgi:uncharacterized OB-fold protein